MSRFKKLSVGVVIPAYNEEKAIKGALDDIPDGVVDQIVVVDNGSDDKTADIARACGVVVVSEPKRGYGSACLVGIEWHRKNPVDVILFMDADRADDPSYIQSLIKPIEDGFADLVIGSRALGERDPGSMTPQAFWGNRLAVALIRLFFGYTYTDLGPFRAIRFSSLEALCMKDKDFGWTVEMQVKAIIKGVKTVEIPVPYRKREGKSKISGTVKGTILAGWKIISTILKLRFTNRQL